MRSRGLAILSTRHVLLFLITVAATCESTASHTTGDPSVSTCVAKTINHITHILPQQCLKGSWIRSTSAQPPIRTEAHARNSQTDAAHEPDPAAANIETLRRQQDKPILTFEEWKELMLRQHGQDSGDLQERHHPERTSREAESPDSAFGTLGDEGEISLNFDIPSDQVRETAGLAEPLASELDGLLYDDGKTQYSRSKDAGKTCKERFSYSSFDAGATVVKASPGTKNPKAILLENKDSYMLFECTAEEKYVIVELSDDILVDTIVLANFEFFSSMVRHFRVSISDRYPIKVEKWRQLGLFEGKNARDIQAFLVENPQIWAKYVRVDFLTYYGNEYYCPVSLLRVHGTRMLESWKETDGSPEDEDPEHETSSGRYLEATTHEENSAIVQDPQAGVSSPRDGVFVFGMTRAVCPAHIAEPRDAKAIKPDGRNRDGPGDTQRRETGGSSQHPVPQLSDALAEPSTRPKADDTTSSAPGSFKPTPSPSRRSSGKKSKRVIGTSTGTSHPSSSITDAPAQNKSAEPTSPHPRNRTTTSSSHSPLPTVQESFFKTVSKRLQLLESNMTWTLKYVEDQSRYIQEALAQTDEEKLSEAEALLGAFNRTRAELSFLHEQYDQVWQSTVIALETQREQSQSELVALSSRLNVLADEVVFQKRMSIGQSILLLCCLVLIIFSRSVTYPMPLTNWQPAPRNTAPSRPRPSREVLYARVGVLPPRNAGNTGPPHSPGDNGFDCRHTARYGRRASDTEDCGIPCEPYGTPDDTLPGQAGSGCSSPFIGLGQYEVKDDGTWSGNMRGVDDARKPLPPLPEELDQ